MAVTEHIPTSTDESCGLVEHPTYPLVVRAVLDDGTSVDSDDPKLAQAMVRCAAFVPMVTEGEPTKLLVSSWLAHEGKNNNGLVFRAEDFPNAAERITAPNLLPLDWNHSAVIPKEGVPKAIGAWYEAVSAWDASAYEGRGAWGIHAKGVVWAWAYPEYASEMVRMYQEQGYLEFSMACIPAAVEMGRDIHGPFTVAIRPVFFTLSALTQAPGDPDAIGHILNPAVAPVHEPSTPWFDVQAASAFLDTDLESKCVTQMLSGLHNTSTAFPRSGENSTVCLSNSQWAVFPLTVAEDLKRNWPEIWRASDHRGDDQFRRLTPVVRRGGEVSTPVEEYAVRLREAWVARHLDEEELSGVVAQVKWLAIGSRGEDHMRSVLNEAKERVRAHRATRMEEERMDDKDLSQVALEAALEANAILKAELENITAAQVTHISRVVEVESALVAMTTRAEEAELTRDALQTELIATTAQVASLSGALQEADDKVNAFVAAQELAEVGARWTARLAELPESYRTVLARRTEDEQARFMSRWSTASDELWSEFKTDVLVGFTDVKLSYLVLSEREGPLPLGGTVDLGVSVAALIK